MAAPSPGIAVADAIALQKRVLYEEEIYDQFEEGTVLHDIVDMGSEVSDAIRLMPKWEGEYVGLQARINRNPNAGRSFNSQTQGMARPGHSQFARLKYVMTEINSSFEMTELAKIKARGNVASVDDLLAVEIDGQLTANRKRVSKILHGDGGGLETTVGSSSAWNNTTKKLTVTNAAVFVELEGMEVIPRNKTTGALGTQHPIVGGEPVPMLIQEVDTANNTITVTDHNGDPLVNSLATNYDSMGLYGYDSQGVEMWGIGIACDTANPSVHGFDPNSPPTDETGVLRLFGGIDRNTNTWWRGNSTTATALGDSTTPSIRRHIAPFLNTINKRTGGKVGWLLGITGFDVHTALADDLSRSQRTNFTYELEGGYEAVKYNNLWTVVDHDADPTKLRVVETDAMFQLIVQGWHIDDTTGSAWSRKFNALGRAMQTFTCYFLTRRQMLWNRCMASGQITGFAAVQ